MCLCWGWDGRGGCCNWCSCVILMVSFKYLLKYCFLAGEFQGSSRVLWKRIRWRRNFSWQRSVRSCPRVKNKQKLCIHISFYHMTPLFFSGITSCHKSCMTIHYVALGHRPVNLRHHPWQHQGNRTLFKTVFWKVEFYICGHCL